MRFLVYQLMLLLLLALPAQAQLLNMGSGGTGGSSGGTFPPGGGGGDGPVTFTGSVTFTGTVTLPNASLPDAVLQSAYSGIGNCASGSFVTGLNRNAAPSCGVASGGIGAPLINPGQGQNNYAAIQNPAFTGNMTINGVSMGAGPWLPVNNPIWTNTMQGTTSGNPFVQMFFNATGQNGATYDSLDIWASHTSAIDYLFGAVGDGEISMYGSAPGTQPGVGVGGTGVYMWEYENGNQLSPIVQVHNISDSFGNMEAAGYYAIVDIPPGYPNVHWLQLDERGANYTSGQIWDYPDSGIIGSMGFNGLGIGSFVGASIDFFKGNQWVATFDDPSALTPTAGSVRGLVLPGLGSPDVDFTDSDGRSALLIGATYFSTQSDYGGELNLSSGATPILGTWNYRADAIGAVMGASIISQGYGPWFGVYWADGGTPAGTQLPQLKPSFEAWGYELYPVHLDNPADAPVPSVSSGQLTAGSRDSFGWIVNVTGSQTTLTFGTPFYSYETTCVLTDAGQPLLWYAAWQSNTSVTFVCTQLNGTACPDNWGWVEYHCAGSG